MQKILAEPFPWTVTQGITRVFIMKHLMEEGKGITLRAMTLKISLQY